MVCWGLGFRFPEKKWRGVDSQNSTCSENNADSSPSSIRIRLALDESYDCFQWRDRVRLKKQKCGSRINLAHKKLNFYFSNKQFYIFISSVFFTVVLLAALSFRSNKTTRAVRVRKEKQTETRSKDQASSKLFLGCVGKLKKTWWWRKVTEEWSGGEYVPDKLNNRHIPSHVLLCIGVIRFLLSAKDFCRGHF